MRFYLSSHIEAARRIDGVIECKLRAIGMMIELIVLNFVVIIITVLVVDLLDNLVISRSNRPVRMNRWCSLIEDVVEVDVQAPEIVLVFELVIVLEDQSFAITLVLKFDVQTRT